MRRLTLQLLTAALVLGTATFVSSTGTATAAADLNIVPLQPARLLETRSGQAQPTVDGRFNAHGRLGAGRSVTFDVVGRGGVDADAAAVMLNVTAVFPDAPGHLTVYPCTDSVPHTSNVNYVPGGAFPNAVLAKLSPQGQVCIRTHAATDVVVDVSGYVPTGGAPVPVEPARLVETRQDPNQVTVDHQYEHLGRVAARTTVKFKVWDRGQPGEQVPADAEAVFLNVTAITPDGPGYLTVYPCSTTVPKVSNLNYEPGQTIPNSVLATVSADGHVCIYTLAAADVIADVNGYLPAGGNRQAIDPARCADTRPAAEGGNTFDGQFLGAGRQPARATYQVTIAGRCHVPDSASAVYVNVTAVHPSAAGYLTVWPCDQPRPATSNVNYLPGQVRPNAVLSKISLDGNGQICIYTLAETHLIVDVSGYVPPPSPGFTTIAHGGTFGCGIEQAGTLVCWGRNLYESLPNFDEPRPNRPGEELGGSVPYRVPNLSGVVDISLYGQTGCALLDDATAVCWGQAAEGHLGDGVPVVTNDDTYRGNTTPIPVVSTSGTGKLANLTQITLGRQHVCAIDTAGAVYCWGRGGARLGTGVTTGRNSIPAQVTTVPAGRTAVDVAPGPDSTCALLDDTTVQCWGFAGDGIYSYLGDGDGDNGGVVMTDAAATTPLTGVVEIDASDRGYCALLDDATVWCWGSNQYGRLGDGTTENRTHAVQVQQVANAVAISGGQRNNCAVTAAGAATCWGWTRTWGPEIVAADAPQWWTVPLPGPAAGLDTTSDSTACWLLDDGFAMCAGWNFDGHLGFPTDSGAGQRNPGYVQTWLAG
ncbi:MAG TPA: hypothetical protein VNQ73_06065 [Ilumatobacter sp.]|nr:hypothetical protein [Ilumatobacter sp.]